jgi:hypothetical protein
MSIRFPRDGGIVAKKIARVEPGQSAKRYACAAALRAQFRNVS